jgi:Flp pilus assembly CpaF family ATPase
MEVDVLIEADGVSPRRERISVDGAMSVGRASYSTLFLDGDLVSRTHALIDIEDEGLRVEDTSSNGTRAGDKLLRRSSTQVAYGTPIQIGMYTLYVSPARRQGTDKMTIPAPSASAPPSVDVPGPPPLPKSTPVPARPAPSGPPPKPLSPAGALPAEARVELRTALASGGSSPTQTVFDRLLGDPSVSKVMVVDPQTVFIVQAGKRKKSPVGFADDRDVRTSLERLLIHANVRMAPEQRVLDARLPDGTRVQAVFSPPAERGTCVTIRRPASTPWTAEALVTAGCLDAAMAKFLDRCVRARKNIVVTGGAASGKTALLGMLTASIPTDERVVVVEDGPELALRQPHVVVLRCQGTATDGSETRDLLRAAMSIEPDRVVLGACRGIEALDLVQAMNTFDGSMTTVNAASPAEAIARVEAGVRAGGFDPPASALRHMLAASMHVLIQMARYPDGSRRVLEVDEVRGLDERGRLVMHPVFEFEQTGQTATGAVTGEHRATGYQPSFVGEFSSRGLLKPGEAPM